MPKICKIIVWDVRIIDDMNHVALPVVLQGVVTKFNGNGRKLGYPTANIITPVNLADGIYFGYADLADYAHQPALIFIGTPVTLGDTGRRVEAYLLDIEDIDYYDKPITLAVEHFHRANQKLKSIEELQAIMKEDERAARTWFGWKNLDVTEDVVNL